MVRMMMKRCSREWTGSLMFILSVLGAASGCARTAEERGEPALETVEVAPNLEVATENDPQAKPRPVTLVGILPTGFPADLPIYLPASVVDFGSASNGYQQAELLSPHPRDQVAAGLEQKLRQNGWSIAPAGGTQAKLSKGNRLVWLEVRDARPGTIFRYQYRPQR